MEEELRSKLWLQSSTFTQDDPDMDSILSKRTELTESSEGDETLC